MKHISIQSLLFCLILQCSLALAQSKDKIIEGNIIGLAISGHVRILNRDYSKDVLLDVLNRKILDGNTAAHYVAIHGDYGPRSINVFRFFNSIDPKLLKIENEAGQTPLDIYEARFNAINDKQKEQKKTEKQNNKLNKIKERKNNQANKQNTREIEKLQKRNERILDKL